MEKTVETAGQSPLSMRGVMSMQSKVRRIEKLKKQRNEREHQEAKWWDPVGANPEHRAQGLSHDLGSAFATQPCYNPMKCLSVRSVRVRIML